MFSTAAPNSTGVVAAARNSSWSWTWPSISSRLISSTAVAQRSPTSSSAPSGSTSSSAAMVAPPAVRAKRTSWSVRRSTRPAKSPATPTGQVSGVGTSPVRCSISSIRASASSPGRSHLLIMVITGRPRRRQTSNSFMVWASSPLAASTSMITESTAASTR